MSEATPAVIGPDLRAALVAMVRKRVPESEVEDIVQSTLADAIESPHAPKDSESLRRWIFGVAKNKVVDYHRRAGRETFELPEVPGKPAPHAEADLLRWAEKHLPPGEENKTTLDWMLREGEGEKLEWIAESERVPAPRVRQRVSRLRRHLKAHWQKEVALLAALGVLVTLVALVLRKKEPEPIADDRLPRAAELRKLGIDRCRASEWKECIEKLDAARQLDPAGDARPEVRQARDDAAKALTLPPVPSPTSEESTPPPPPSAAPSAAPAPTQAPRTESTAPKDMKMPAPIPTEAPAKPKPAPLPVKGGSHLTGDFGSIDTPAPTLDSSLGGSSLGAPPKPAGDSKLAPKQTAPTKKAPTFDRNK